MQARDVQTFVEQSYLKTSQRSDVGSYQLDRALSHDRAAIYFDPQANSVVVVNRGTNPTLGDWTNNYMLATGQYNETERMQNALDTQHAVIAKYPDAKITNIAHSQSQAIVTNLNDRGLTDQVITLNGATTPWDTQQKTKLVYVQNWTLYRPLNCLRRQGSATIPLRQKHGAHWMSIAPISWNE